MAHPFGDLAAEHQLASGALLHLGIHVIDLVTKICPGGK